MTSACTGHLLGTEVGKVVRERRATAKICVGCLCHMTGEFVGLITFVSSKSCSSLFCALLCYPCVCTRAYMYVSTCAYTHTHMRYIIICYQVSPAMSAISTLPPASVSSATVSCADLALTR